jgi:peptidyl-prolyl cis-trans isomerase SurA
LAGALGLTAPLASAEIIEQVLVKVNGDIFTKTDLEARQVSALRARNQQFSEEDLRDEAKLRQIVNEITPQLIVDVIDEMLLLQRGRTLGYRLTDEGFNNILENIKKENNITTEEQFQAALKQEGLTMEELRRSLERQMLVSRVQQTEILGKISVTEAEERAYYEKHADEFTAPSNVTLREILVSTEAAQTDQGLNVGLDDDARKEAEDARARILAGADFATVAAEVSDAPSKANGGLIGPIGRAELSKALQDAIAPLQVGEVSAILRTPRGYHFVKLENATPPTVQPFEQARSAIASKLAAEKRQHEFQEYLKKLRAQALIEWKNDELRQAYVKGLASRGPAAPATN